MDKTPVILMFMMLLIAVISRCASVSNIIMNARMLAMAMNPFGLDNAQSYHCRFKFDFPA